MSSKASHIPGGSNGRKISFEAGEPVKENTFEDYGIQTVPIMQDGDTDTGRRFIMKDGKFIADVTSRYNLIPNEKVLELTDEIADDLGAEPFDKFDGGWYATMDDHAITDDEGRRLHAMYSWSEDTVAGDDMNYGFIVHNSIDKSLGFSVGLFTFRNACSNMVWMAAGKNAAEGGMNFDDRNVISSYYHRHTNGLETSGDELKELVRSTVDRIPEVHETYEEWADTGITVDEVKALRDRLPHSDLPEWVQEAQKAIQERQKKLDEDEELDSTAEDVEFLDKMPTGESKWEVYNDLTEKFWHNDDTSDQTKRKKNKDAHRVLTPAQGVR